MILSFHFKHDHAKDIITIKKKKIKREKEGEGFKYFERCNVKKYCDKENLNTFYLMCLKIFCMIRKKFLST